MDTEKIKSALTAFSAYSKRLAENQGNKNDFLRLINTAVDNLMEYHLFHYCSLNLVSALDCPSKCLTCKGSPVCTRYCSTSGWCGDSFFTHAYRI